MNIKLADFNFACRLDPAGLNLVCGTPLYRSPEMILGQLYNEKSDIWSIGVIACMLLTGQNLFSGKSKEEAQK